MSLEKLLEVEFKPAFCEFAKAKVILKVHCSCGKDYKIKEKFPEKYLGENYYVKASKCPKCKDVSYVEHKIITREDDADYSAIIVTDDLITSREIRGLPRD